MRAVARQAVAGLVVLIVIAIVIVVEVRSPSISPMPSPADLSTFATGDGSLDLALPIGLRIEALPGTFPPRSEIRVWAADSRLLAGVPASVVGQALAISALSQPNRPVVVSTPIPQGLETSTVVGLLWDERTSVPTVLPVAARDGQLIAEIPHFSVFSFVSFPSVASLTKWLADTVVDRYLSFLQQTQCPTAISSQIVQAVSSTGSGELVISANDIDADSVRFVFCNPSQHFIAYTVQGDVIGAPGFIPPQRLSSQVVSMTFARSGAQVRILGQVDAGAWLLSVASLFVLAVPVAGPSVVQVLLGDDLNELYDSVSPAASCLDSLRLGAQGRSAEQVASDAAACILQSPAADRLQALVIREAAKSSLSALETAARMIPVAAALQQVALVVRVGEFLQEIASGSARVRREYQFAAIRDGRSIRSAIATAVPTLPNRSTPERTSMAIASPTPAPRPSSVAPVTQRPTPTVRPLVPGVKRDCGSGSQNNNPFVVAVYADIDYTGLCIWLSVGDWDDLNRDWAFGGHIRSIYNPNAYHVTLFERINFQGAPGFFDTSVPQLTGYWLDRTQSIRIESPAVGVPLATPAPTGTPASSAPQQVSSPPTDLVAICPWDSTSMRLNCSARASNVTAATTYSWSIPGGAPSSGTGVTFVTVLPWGLFTLTLQACNGSACTTFQNQMNLTAPQSPAPSPNIVTVSCSASVAVGQPVICSAVVSGGTSPGPLTFGWYASGGVPDHGNMSAFTTTFATPGDKLISLSVCNGSTCAAKIVGTTVTP